MRLPVNRLLPLAAPILLAGCLAGGGDRIRPPAPPANGPAADYPVVIGEPFTIGDKTYTPDDALNYDAVGYAVVGQGDTPNVTASHKTLPLPSYVEVTDLNSGHTTLVRVETRGPMRNDMLLELSPAAARQLGITAKTVPVRVRRVNPPETDRAKLRAGEQAPARMDTPEALLTVLKRKLENHQPVGISVPNPSVIAAIDPDAKSPKVSTPEPQPQAQAQPSPQPALPPKPAVKPKPAPKPEPEKSAATDKAPAPPAKPAQTGNRYVQVGAFSTQERAKNAAAPVGGKVSQAGKYWIVRIGPMNSATEAAAALEKARKSGYRDAIVRRID